MAKINDGRVVERVQGQAGGRLLLLCDHASNALPPEYSNLGLAPAQFERHIAYDIGARAVTLWLVASLGGTAVLSCFSRLLIDPNRGMDDPTLIMRLSDGAVVPGNRNVDDAERQRRIEGFHRPYHAAITGEINRLLGEGLTPLIVSLHSFTPVWKTVQRPWHVGILWDRDEAVARAMIGGFEKQGDLVVGDNEPYHGALEGDTLHTHGTMRSLPHVLIEIRQDLIAAKSGVDEWVERVAKVIEPIMYQTQDEPMDMDEKTRTELEAAAYRRLLQHLRERTDVQNIDMMNLAGFCRNCLSNWFEDAAKERGVAVSRDEVRHMVYGMSYADWKAKHQSEASPEQSRAFEISHKH